MAFDKQRKGRHEIDWSEARSPDLAVFEALVRAAYGELPESFRALTGDIVIRVAELPADDALDDLGIDSPFDLLGLFEGYGLAQGGGEAATGQAPNRVSLYRRPILDYWAEHDEALGSIVTHVLVHEIGHHFGLSDDDMEAIEAAVERAETGSV